MSAEECHIVSRSTRERHTLAEHLQTDLEKRLQGAERELSSLSADLAAAHKRLRRDSGSSTAEEQLAAARKCEEAALAQARMSNLLEVLRTSHPHIMVALAVFVGPCCVSVSLSSSATFGHRSLV